MVAEGTNRTYNHIGIPDSFHPVSHHANDLARIEKLAKIQTWHMEQFAKFIRSENVRFAKVIKDAGIQPQ